MNAFAGLSDGGTCYPQTRIVELKRKFDLPDVLKGPYLLEKAREDALYSKDRKWVLLCLFVPFLLSPHQEKRKSFEGAVVNRDIFHDSTIIEVVKENFIVVQVSFVFLFHVAIRIR